MSLNSLSVFSAPKAFKNTSVDGPPFPSKPFTYAAAFFTFNAFSCSLSTTIAGAERYASKCFKVSSSIADVCVFFPFFEILSGSLMLSYQCCPGSLSGKLKNSFHLLLVSQTHLRLPLLKDISPLPSLKSGLSRGFTLSQTKIRKSVFM